MSSSVPGSNGRVWRSFLFSTAATAGAAVMIVEILGAKMLSPYVGTSHFVWTAQIAVTLVALACGYYLGGRLSERGMGPVGLYLAIMGAAAYLGLGIRVLEPVAYWCLDFSLPVGTLFASVLLFFPPLLLLAITGPFLARLVTESVDRIGGSVGRLTAASTIGSGVGTLLIGYVLIPWLSNAVAMYVTVTALFLLSAVYFLFTATRGAMAFPLAMIAVMGVVALPQLAGGTRLAWMQERFRANSHFGMLQVLDDPAGSVRYYLNDNLVQNTYSPSEKKSASAFTYLLSDLARAYTTNLNDALCIGVGIGIVPMDFATAGVRVDAVEINPDIVPMAVRWFDFDPGKVNLVINDARHVLNRTTNHYDAVILDAFLGDSSPAHLMTREAFESMRRVMKPGAVLVINSFAVAEPGRDYFAASLEKTLRSVFKGVKLHANGDGATFFVAGDREDLRIVRAPVFSHIHVSARAGVERAFSNLVSTDPSHGRVLTDDHNPVEFFDAKNREQVRRNLTETVKRF